MDNLTTIEQFWSGYQDLGALPPDYPTWTAAQKQAFLWEDRILPSKYDRLPPIEKINILGLIFTRLKTKMDRLADEAPRQWQKAIHAHGCVAQIKFYPAENTPFTGLFKGANGLLRASITGEPSDRGFAPGLAIKFFVDGKPSQNFSALVSLSGQGQNYNFFANEFSNIVPVVNEFGPKFSNFIFRRVTRYPTRLYLQDLAEITEQGQREPKPHYPAQVFLVPNPELKFPESPPHDFREDLATIAPETTLFSLYAVDSSTIGDEAIGQLSYRQQAQQIGQITTTSEFVSSFYGDYRLFFRHQRFRNK